MDEIRKCQHGNTFSCLQCEVDMLGYVIDDLKEEVDHLRFENHTIRTNRATQEREDFKRIQQLEQHLIRVLRLTGFCDASPEELQKSKDYELVFINGSMGVRKKEKKTDE